MPDQCPAPKKVKRKKSVTVETGFSCAACDVETVTYDGSIATKCINCNEPNPKKVWKNIITHELTVESIRD